MMMASVRRFRLASPPRYLSATLLLCLAAVSTLAQEDAGGDSPQSLIAAKLAQARPDLAVQSVRPSEATGLYEVQLVAGPSIYATGDGDFFVLGDLFAVNMDGITNLTERKRDDARRELLAGIDDGDMIIFAAEGERRGSVTVFTDVDCFYCQKLHKEVPALNKLGVEVRYLAYPRAGVGSDSYRKIASAWCADDPRDAITRLKARKDIPENVCPNNPVADQLMLGQQAGVRGTPALVLESGEMVAGYMAADQLAERMGIN